MIFFGTKWLWDLVGEQKPRRTEIQSTNHGDYNGDDCGDDGSCNDGGIKVAITRKVTRTREGPRDCVIFFYQSRQKSKCNSEF